MRSNLGKNILILLSVLMGVVLACCRTSGATQDEARDPFERMVPTIALKRQTMFEAIAKLYEATEIPISVERVLSDVDASKTDPKFTATLPGGTPARVLDEICGLDNRYMWSRDLTAVNIFPKSSSRDPRYVFNRRIPVFRLHSVLNTGIAAVQAAGQVPEPRPQLMVLEAGGIDFDKPWTVTIPNLTIRQAINRIATHACPGCGWQLTGTRALPIVMFYRSLHSGEAE